VVFGAFQSIGALECGSIFRVVEYFLSVGALVECWSIFAALEHWSVFGVFLECWSIGALERWNVGALECWSILEVLEHWSIFGAVEHFLRVGRVGAFCSFEALEHFWSVFGVFEHLWSVFGMFVKKNWSGLASQVMSSPSQVQVRPGLNSTQLKAMIMNRSDRCRRLVWVEMTCIVSRRVGHQRSCQCPRLPRRPMSIMFERSFGG